MQTKTTMKYHFTRAEWPPSTNQQTSAGEDVKKRESFRTVLGMQTGAATKESSMDFPQKMKNGTAISTSGNISKET